LALAARLAAAVLFLLAAGAAVRHLTGGGAPPPPAKKNAVRPAVPVEVAPVTRRPIREIGTFSGTVRPSFRILVAPRIPGRILSLAPQEGDPVAEGEVIARLEDEELRQSSRSAEAELRVARASPEEAVIQRERSRQTLERVRELEGKTIASREELDQAAADFQTAEQRVVLASAQVEQKAAALEVASVRLGYARLASPRSGIVGERFVDEGSSVGANDPVVSILGVDPVTVHAAVAERLQGRVRVGRQVEVQAEALPSHRFRGTISRIPPGLEEESRTMELEIRVPNAGGLLKPGMFVRAEVVLLARESAQVVPAAALVARNGDTGVFLVDADGIARWVPVVPGIATPQGTEIVSPPLEGRVVTLGQHLLQDGGAVTVAGAERPPGP
jgi:RND family efflux transporter MFP subunit